MLSVRVRSPKGVAVVQIAPSSSFKEFQEKALAAVSLSASSSFTYRAGFPPKEIDAMPDTPVEHIFQNQDTVVIEPQNMSTRVSRPKKGKFTGSGVGVMLGAASTAPAAPQPPVEPKVAGKPKAVIKVIPNRKRFQGTGVKLSDSTPTTAPAISSNTSVPATTAGIGGAPSSASTSEPKRRRTMINLGSKEDVEIKLVQAVSGGGSTKTDKFFRKATKTAVAYQYDTALANTRLKAAWANKFIIQMVDARQMKVRFMDGVRTWKEEIVDCLQPTELRTAIQYAVLDGDKEMLKPFNMAQCSPRVFWSLARLYNGDVGAGLAALLPHEDWSFLDTRTRTLSAKALESLATGGGRWRKEEEELPDETAPMPVVPVQHNHEEMAKKAEEEATARTVDLQALRNATARAALARLHQPSMLPSTAAVTSTTAQKDSKNDEEDGEEEEDETLTVFCDDCGKARIVAVADKSRVNLQDDEEDKPWTCANLAAIDRSSGCAAPDDELVRAVDSIATAATLDALQVTRRLELANANAEELFSKWRRQFPTQTTSLDRIEALIQEARFQQLDDCMQEILAQAPSGTFQVLEAAKVATPYDLSATPVDLLWREVEGVSLEEVQGWQTAAKQAMEISPWMEEWRSI
ncbi:hypothetical protein LEN26_017638 [Aphanomyces euteiches]|nr:hypothetical protein LEN26_017638 [Aphanomyces euteiches]